MNFKQFCFMGVLTIAVSACCRCVGISTPSLPPAAVTQAAEMAAATQTAVAAMTQEATQITPTSEFTLTVVSSAWTFDSKGGGRTGELSDGTVVAIVAYEYATGWTLVDLDGSQLWLHCVGGVCDLPDGSVVNRTLPAEE